MAAKEEPLARIGGSNGGIATSWVDLSVGKVAFTGKGPSTTLN